MYDHQTESLWSQVKSEAVAGPLTGRKLKILSSTLTTWGKWKRQHPHTEVLSINTGYDRNYSRDPYESYYKKEKGFFSSMQNGKELVAGVVVNGAAKAYSVNKLREKGKTMDTLNGKKLRLKIEPATDSLTIQDENGNKIPYIITYWFVWKGIYPNSVLFH